MQIMQLLLQEKNSLKYVVYMYFVPCVWKNYKNLFRYLVCKLLTNILQLYGRIQLPYLCIHKHGMDDSSVNFHDKVFLYFFEKFGKKRRKSFFNLPGVCWKQYVDFEYSPVPIFVFVLVSSWNDAVKRQMKRPQFCRVQVLC